MFGGEITRGSEAHGAIKVLPFDVGSKIVLTMPGALHKEIDVESEITNINLTSKETGKFDLGDLVSYMTYYNSDGEAYAPIVTMSKVMVQILCLGLFNI